MRLAGRIQLPRWLTWRIEPLQPMLKSVTNSALPKGFLIAGTAVLVLAAGLLVSAGDLRRDAAPAVPNVIPLDEVMRYGVSWAGIHCGAMTLESSVEQTEDGRLFHIVMTARTSKFFDGIHRVRSRIESVFSEARMSSVSYHENSTERKKVKDSLWVVDFDNRRVVRTEDGDEREIPIDSRQVYDPLAFIYRVRLLVDKPGDEVTLTMVTGDGDADTVAEVVEKKTISTPFGKREALRIVPRPEDEMLFSKKGSMSIWVSTDEARIPYRIEFDLSFGKLVAKLREIEKE